MASPRPSSNQHHLRQNNNFSPPNPSSTHFPAQRIENQFQQLHIGSHQPSVPPNQHAQPPQAQYFAQTPETLAPSTSLPKYNKTEDSFEPPPGPPPGWMPQAQAPAPAPSVSTPSKAEQKSQLGENKDSASQEQPIKAHEWPKYPPKAHPSGLTPLAQCASNPVNLDLDWFHVPSIPSSYVCTRCYVDYVYDTTFTDLFKKIHCDSTESRKCYFGSSRMTEQLWPTAVTSGDITPVFDFMKKRIAIPECQGATMLGGKSWYVTEDIPGSSMCQACFEDLHMLPSFREKYTLKTIETECYCDGTMWYINRMFTEHTKTGNWAALVQGVAGRITAPACPMKQDVKSAGRSWFQAKEGFPSLQICVACYIDYFYGTEDEESFNQVSGGDYDTHCQIGNSYLQFAIKYPFAKSLKAGSSTDLKTFWKTVQTVRSQPPCSADGIQGGNWYTFPNNPAGFGICEGCYASIKDSMDGAQFFVPKVGGSSEKILCSFNLSHIRFGNYFPRFVHSLLTGEPKYLGDYATKFGNVFACPRDHYRRGVNRKFWGWGVAAICEECYLIVAKGTSLESQFALKGDPDPKGRMCDLYSPRTRKLYLEACETGDLQSFLEFGEKRHAVWCETIAVCDQIEADIRMAAFQANRLRSSANFYKFLGNSVDNTMGHSHTVGNSYAGYGHANDYMVTGYTHGRQAQEASAQVTSMSSSARMATLRQRWAEFE